MPAPDRRRSWEGHDQAKGMNHGSFYILVYLTQGQPPDIYDLVTCKPGITGLFPRFTTLYLSK